MSKVNLTFVKKRAILGPFCPGRPGEKLPGGYKKFWAEWKKERPEAVHYIPEQGYWKRNPETGETKRVQNVPIPLKIPREMQQYLLGGEAVIQGYQKRNPYKRRVPHFWVPHLFQSVVYSEILNQYMSVVMTERARDLILKHKGLDNYILETKACDLRTDLAVKLKHKLLNALLKKELAYEDPIKKKEVYEKYEHFLANYTEEEIEWYGLTYKEAIAKLNYINLVPVQPLKNQYRLNLVKELLEQKLQPPDSQEDESKSWLSKMNPFISSK